MSRLSSAQRQQAADDAWSDGEAVPAFDWRARAKQYGPFYPPHLPLTRSRPRERDEKLKAGIEGVLAQIERAFGKGKAK